MSELISMRFECLRIAAAMKLPARETVAAARSFEEYLRDVVPREKQRPRPVVELMRASAEPRDIRSGSNAGGSSTKSDVPSTDNYPKLNGQS